MKTLKYITYLFVGVLLFSSCEVDYLSSPNQPEVAPTYGILNRVQKRLMDDTRDEWFSGRQMLTWVQYWNQVNYTEEDRFQYRENTNQAAWDDLYKNAQDLIDIINFNSDDATKNDMAAYGANAGQISAARVMLVYTYLLATELWGDVPYWSYMSDNPNFQANQLKGEDANFAPAYAPQAEIYADMLATLDACQASFGTLAAAEATPLQGDNYYNGDYAMWQKYANSLRLRIANRVKGVVSGADAHITSVISSGIYISDNSENAAITYGTTDNVAAPMYRAFYVSNRTDFAPSYSFVELLKGADTDFHTNQFGADPRLGVFVATNKDGFKLGIPLTDANGTVGSFAYESLPGDAILANNATEMVMEYAEVCFLISENSGWDQTWYEKGVAASLERWGLSTSYVASLPAANALPDGENVLMQKYIALYMQSMEAWSEYRRTGFPNNIVRPNEAYNYTYNYKTASGDVTSATKSYIFKPIGGLEDVPSRNKYLLNEANINGANLSAAVSAMGSDAQDTPMIWSK